MSSLGSPSPFFLAGKKAYQVERSLRFNDNDSAYLTRTPSSDGNRRTFTISFWIKRANLTTGHIFQQRANSNDSRQFTIQFRSGEKLRVLAQDGGSTVLLLDTTQVFRDPSAWYHIVVAIDSTQSTQSDRQKLYVNGQQITDFDTNTQTSQDRQFSVNHATKRILIGNQRPNSSSTLTSYLDAYLAEYHLVDGLQLTPSSFGETDVLTGQWNPKEYVGNYGTNGFYLNFSDNSGTTATTLGKDSSGNGNNFTPNNFSVAAGAGNDSLEDTPTNNFATMNPLANKFPASTFSEGNLSVAMASSKRTFNTSTFGVKTGKWYFEMKPTATGSGSDNCVVGIVSRSDSTGTDDQLGASTSVVFRNNGNIKKDGSNATHGASWTTSNIVMVAIDADNNNVYFGVDGQWADGSGNNDEANPTSAVSFTSTMISHGVIFAAFGDLSLNDPNPSGSFNFGQQAFSYTPPTGYKKINSANLPDPTILLPNKHFEPLIYTGDSNTSRNITGLQFQPDWVWIKRRSATANHRALDSVRGSTKELYPNLTNVESTFTGISSFNSDGFTLATADPNYNLNTATYVAWNWNAGDTDGKTYTVKVVSDGGNKYRFDDFGTSAVTLDLAEGGTYIFDGADSSMASHPIKLSETSNGTHGGGSSYNTGVTYLLDGASVTESAYVSGYSSATTRQLKIVVAASAPTLYYYCHYHSGMGGQANTNSTLGSSNFDGAIQSTVKVNASAGFSIVSYTGSGSTTTAGHGLGVAPVISIRKARNATADWFVHHTLVDGSMDFLRLNTTASNSNSSLSAFTSTVFPVDDNTNQYIIYCFSEVAGYSKFGSYTGNGSSDGTFVFTGFRPAFLIVKATGLTESWYLYDNKRNTFNAVDKYLRADNSLVEGTFVLGDLLSNGFKIRQTDSALNTSGQTYIYLAFAEAPFKNARAR